MGRACCLLCTVHGGFGISNIKFWNVIEVVRDTFKSFWFLLSGSPFFASLRMLWILFFSFASCNGCLANCCHAILLNLAFENRCLFSRIFRYFEHYSICIVFLPFDTIRKMKCWNKWSLWTYCQCTDVQIIDVNLWSFFRSDSLWNENLIK